MLFDYILDDRNLAIPMKALIGRLQIPIVKLGIIDKSFFENSGHPARQLLNELSSAGIGWSATTELRRDALYDKIESIVLRVMNGFKQDPNIFAELLQELRDFVTADEKQHAPVEQRTKETETDKAKTIAAKTIVQQLINQKASGMRLIALRICGSAVLDKSSLRRNRAGIGLAFRQFVVRRHPDDPGARKRRCIRIYRWHA